jgi:hypothetical protein
VAAGASATFTVLFKPTSPGAKTASLILPNNDTDEGPFNLTLTATATPDLRITTFTAIKPSGGNPGSINISVTGSQPNAQMRLQASSDLAVGTTLRTLTIDSLGGVTTGVISDPGNTNVPPRRFYRVTLP